MEIYGYTMDIVWKYYGFSMEIYGYTMDIVWK